LLSSLEVVSAARDSTNLFFDMQAFSKLMDNKKTTAEMLAGFGVNTPLFGAPATPTDLDAKGADGAKDVADAVVPKCNPCGPQDLSEINYTAPFDISVAVAVDECTCCRLKYVPCLLEFKLGE